MRALIIVDMLNDFVDGRLANPKAQAIIAPLQRLLAHARDEGWVVVFSPELEVLHIGGVSTGGYRSRKMVVEHSRSIYKYFVKFGSPGWKAALRPLARLVLRLRAEVVLLRRSQH